MTDSRRLRMSKLTLGLVAALAAAPAFAQSTSAGVGGVVTGASGQPVPGAEVTIVHVESGTISRAVTDASGRFSARGLRVGGPYTVTINKPGFKTYHGKVTHQTSGGGAAGMAGNVIVGGLIGIGVDAATGSTQELKPNPLVVKLEPEGAAATSGGGH